MHILYLLHIYTMFLINVSIYLTYVQENITYCLVKSGFTQQLFMVHWLCHKIQNINVIGLKQLFTVVKTICVARYCVCKGDIYGNARNEILQNSSNVKTCSVM
jgi:hypothetical protein